jgi:hypothetical protein
MKQASKQASKERKKERKIKEENDTTVKDKKHFLKTTK